MLTSVSVARLSVRQKGLRAFEETYSRLALVNQSSGDIMYTTPELVEYCGTLARFRFDDLG